MFKTILFVMILSVPAWSGVDDELLALERKALDGWMKGDPDPQFALFDPSVTYFHAVTETRIDGLSGVKELFAAYRGTPLFEGYEILRPRVQTSGDIAVLTYQLARRNGSVKTYWNSTQVYEKKNGSSWRVIHSHWSPVKPNLR